MATVIKLIFRPVEDDDRLVVFVARQNMVKEIEGILLGLGFSDVKCYVDGVPKWKRDGYMVGYPRFIKFRVRLK